VGTTQGIDAEDVDEFTLLPAAFFANTRKTYDVPFVRPVTVTEVAVDTVSVNVVHVLPLLLEYCMT
jgi:hypothetical protein